MTKVIRLSNRVTRVTSRVSMGFLGDYNLVSWALYAGFGGGVGKGPGIS